MSLRNRGVFGGCVAVAILLAFAFSAPATPHGVATGAQGFGRVPRAGNERFVDGELIVRFKAGVGAQARASALRAEGAAPLKNLALPRAELVRVSRGSVRDAVADFERRPDVLYAEPNWIYHLSATPNDGRFGELWGLSQASDADIDAPEAWDHETGDPSVVVAVVDSGVAYDHPDIAPNRWVNDDPPGGGDEDGNGKPDDTFGWDFVQDDNTPYDYNGHGTHVAGTIGGQGNNATGVTGVNWDVQLMPVRAGDADGGLETQDIVDSFLYACREGARVVNGSFGGSGVSQAMYDAIVSPDCTNTLFVLAAGNDGESNDAFPHYPCNYHRPGGYGVGATNVVCVAATNGADQLTDFSNYGALSVHLAAPGDDILSTWPAYQIIRAADGFDDSADSSFDSRWGDRTFTTGDQLWGRTTLHKDSGTHSLTDSPVGNYTDNTRTTVRLLPPVSLTGEVGCRVAYDILLDTEFLFDPFLVLTGTTTATPTVAGGWWGSSGGRFFPLSSDLSMMDGQSTVYVRLGLQSDGSDTFDGVYVDDLSVECVDHSGSAYDAISGTSMASPHVAGVAALALAQNPALTTLELKGRLLSAVDVLPQLAGSVSTSGRLNACRALVGCIPTSPPQPPQPPRPPADTIGPIDPVVSSPSHTVGVPSRNRVIQFRWSGASDVGSGVDGFSFHIDQSAVSTPDRIKDAEENIASMTTAPLPNGRYYFHLSTVDNAGNWTNTRHFGPIIISVPRTGSGVQCRVPDVRGKTLARSRQLLTRANCRLGAVRRVYSGRMRSGRVVSQSRRPGARLPRWTRINVKVSRGRGR